MDAVLRSPATWIIMIVALVGAYKLGKDASKLNKAEGRAGSEDSDASTESKAKEEDVKDDDWEWPVYDAWWSMLEDKLERKLRVQERGKRNSAPFEVTYEQRRSWPCEVMVKLRSKLLIQVAKECVPKHLEKLVIMEPEINGRELFIALNSFKAYESEHEDDLSLDKCHLKHLIRFLETEYKDTIVLTERMRRRKTVSWELLWAFLHKGERVSYTCAMTGQTLLGIVWHVHYGKINVTEEKFFSVQLECRDYNGKYVKSSVTIDIYEFRAENSFESLGICPLNLLEQSDVEALETKFLENGNRFYRIVSQGSYYVNYKGPRQYKEKSKEKSERFLGAEVSWELKKQNADGRVMVDLQSFARMNPGYPLNDAEPWTGSSSHSRTCADTERPSDEYLMLAPAVVYGFSFSNKKWGGFNVSGLSSIKFDDQAFDRNLVLKDPSRKQMLLGLVSEYVLRNPNDVDAVPKLDPISNKGEGCIFLCYGPPGTGKTLTAESIAEKLNRPLWSINVFELGRNSEDLETKLLGILDIAWQWQAVLLLDEADIYMEKRTSSGDPERTAMTSIFLRLLESYRGVLFLTTNRVASFDDAFCSRISMFLRYHRLGGAEREAVWSNMFARAGIDNPDLTPFKEARLNGREIRNTVRIAQTWAKSSGAQLTTAHVLEVVNMLGEFRHDLQGAIEEESDEGSITQARKIAKTRSMKVGRDTTELNGNFEQVASLNERQTSSRRSIKKQNSDLIYSETGVN